VDARNLARNAAPDEPVEEGITASAAVGDARSVCVLAWHAHPRVTHHEHQELRLPPGEAAVP
jgi:hypothetical protein